MSSYTAERSGIDLEEYIRFYKRYYQDEIGELVQHYPSEQQSLWVSWRDLFRYSKLPHITEDLRNHPETIISEMEEALANYDVPADMDLSGATVRVHDLPETELRQVNEAWDATVGQYIGVSGQVSKVTQVHKEPLEVAYECQRCGITNEIPQSGEELQEPHECSGCERQGPFVIDYQRSRFRPHQLARIRQPPEETEGGDGATLDMHVRGDLVQSISAGDRVKVSGTYSLSEPSNDEATFEEHLDAQAVDFAESDYEDIDVDEHAAEIEAIAAGEQGDVFELLRESIAPKVHGYDHIKDSIALQLFGGVRAEYPDGSVDRGDSHILLLGDPGTAKSTLLRAVEELSPRAVYASGKGATAAGMTASAVKDDFGDSGQWTLEAGALVLANGGVACVDEIDKVREDAISSMHDALESQRITVNKAGINATLPAETALLAAGNPKYGRFDSNEPIGDQIELGPTIMSRFDLMFMVDDTPDRETDEEIAASIMKNRSLATAYAAPGTDTDADAFEEIKPAIESDVLRAYIAYAKENCHPRIKDPEVFEDMKESFLSIRELGGDDSAVPVTFRKLEGIQRLAQASARVRLSNEVELEDVDRARELIGRSMREVQMDEETGEFDADIIETGTPKSQKDRIDLIKELADDFDDGDNGAPIADIKKECTSEGFDRGRVNKDIDKLKAKGEVIEAEPGYLRLIKNI